MPNGGSAPTGEQCLWARIYTDVDDLRHTVATFTRLYNTQRLIERHGHPPPHEAYTNWQKEVAA